MLIGYYFLAWTPRCFQRGTNPSRALLILSFTDKLGEVGRRKSHLAEICQTTKRITILSNSSESHYNQSSEQRIVNATQQERHEKPDIYLAGCPFRTKAFTLFVGHIVPWKFYRYRPNQNLSPPIHSFRHCIATV